MGAAGFAPAKVGQTGSIRPEVLRHQATSSLILLFGLERVEATPRKRLRLRDSDRGLLPCPDQVVDDPGLEARSADRDDEPRLRPEELPDERLQDQRWARLLPVGLPRAASALAAHGDR